MTSDVTAGSELLLRIKHNEIAIQDAATSRIAVVLVGKLFSVKGEDLIDIKVEVIDDAEEMMDVWADQQDGSRRRNPPERSPRPLYSPDCPEEKHNIPEDHQEEDPTKNKVKEETEEEAMKREYQPCVSDGKEEIPGDVSTESSYLSPLFASTASCTEADVLVPLHPSLPPGDMKRPVVSPEVPCYGGVGQTYGCHPSATMEAILAVGEPEHRSLSRRTPGNPCDNSSLSLNCKKEDIRKHSYGESLITLHGPPGLHSTSLSYNPPNHEEPFPEQSRFVTTIPGDKVDTRFQCHKEFTKSSDYLTQSKHKREKPYSCSECGKCFPNKSKMCST
ncbi:unnamed protein product [Ranitomeya imitator]|uniref:Uncharacterized protein n=1 Tax=Ranitomeya imitator TaxID=111125 RepID=A0ABN9MDA9_9NEOB|nr:unnamed protein product [Ranitomeya imitator]